MTDCMDWIFGRLPRATWWIREGGIQRIGRWWITAWDSGARDAAIGFVCLPVLSLMFRSAIGNLFTASTLWHHIVNFPANGTAVRHDGVNDCASCENLGNVRVSARAMNHRLQLSWNGMDGDRKPHPKGSLEVWRISRLETYLV